MSVTHRAGAYLRLSDKDRHLDPHEQSESIENQRAIIVDYVNRNPEIELVDFFIDDGYTGLNYDREGFQEMMERIDAGEMNMIITKELSRLGREHAETIHLFKHVFPRKKIRYVAVLDRIDFHGRIEGVDIPFKVLMNDFYSQTISNSVTNTNRNLQRQGKYIAAFAPYGYKKDPKDKHHLVVDEESAHVVRKIYTYYRDGKSIDWICRKLTADQEMPPAEYKKKSTNYKTGKSPALTRHWTYTTVWKILKDETYLGTVVQHRREKIAYNLQDMQRVPEEEVIKVEKMHEAIVSGEEFETVQTLMKSRRRMGAKDLEHPNIFAGAIVCASCGRSLGRVKDHHYEEWYYRCNTYARMGKQYCSCHKIYEKTVKEIVLQAVKENVLETEVFQNTKWNLKDMYKKVHRRNAGLQEKQRKRLEKLEQERGHMVAKLAKEIITEEDFLLYKREYEAEKEQLRHKISCLQKQGNDDTIVNEKYQNWVDEFIVHKELKSLTRDIVIHLVDRVIVYEGNEVEIQFKFQNPLP